MRNKVFRDNGASLFSHSEEKLKLMLVAVTTHVATREPVADTRNHIVVFSSFSSMIFLQREVGWWCRGWRMMQGI